jgi:hypothetical protein
MSLQLSCLGNFLDSQLRSAYDSITMPVLIFIRELLVATFTQMATLFGGIFLFGIIINIFSQMSFRSIEKSFWSKGTYVVAWLGTPVHELGHALFCVIFMHRIEEIQLFNPDPVTGTLGFVYHKWSRSNPYQVLGNLFIGIGPVLLGCSVLFALFYFLIPDSSSAWNSVRASIKEIGGSNSVPDYLRVIGASAFTMTGLIFSPANLAGWRLWVFIYLSVCIASNIRLSMADIKGSVSGLGYLVLIFLLINLLGIVNVIGQDKLFQAAASVLGIVYSLLTVALVMSILGFCLIYLITAVYVKISRGYLLNPFWG